MIRIKRTLALAVFILSAIAAPVFAQEATDAPTEPAPTVEVTVVPEPTPELEPIAGVPAVTVWPVIAFLSLVALGVFEAVRARQAGKFSDRLVQILERRDIQDAVEREYAKSSMSVKDFVMLLRSGLVVVGNANIPIIDPAIDEGVEFIDAIRDGQPNTEPRA